MCQKTVLIHYICFSQSYSVSHTTTTHTHTDHQPPHLVLTPLQLCANLPPPEYVGFGRGGWLGTSATFKQGFALGVCVCVCMHVCASNGFHPHYPIISSCCALLTGFLEGEFQTCHRIYSEFPEESHWISTPYAIGNSQKIRRLQLMIIFVILIYI